MKKIIYPLTTLVLGGVLTWILFCQASPLKKTCLGYPFISEEIDCEAVNDKINQVENLHNDIQKIVDLEKKQNHIIRTSVFYRDLNTRRWFGVNDTDRFYPASLIKLPIAILYYKMAELQPDIFDKKLQISPDMPDNSDQHYPPEKPLAAGQYYTVREMISHMLQYSDNAPFSILYDDGGVFRDKVLSDLNIYEPPAGSGAGEWSVTARNYANIFRMLYNASYVDLKAANEILSILSQSTFIKGIVAGVPSDVKIAHKFGEAAGVDQNNNIQSIVLNDCGIVYRKDDPYILCVMAEGKDYAEIEKVIENISKSTYDAL